MGYSVAIRCILDGVVLRCGGGRWRARRCAWTLNETRRRHSLPLPLPVYSILRYRAAPSVPLAFH